MPICYWNLCHCPDGTPCAEHQGSNCSLFNNTVVTDESQIKDSTTRDLEAAVLNFSKDRARIDTIKDELQTQKDFLEHEKNEIERDTKTATNMSQRRALAQRASRTEDKIKQMADELARVNDELDAMLVRWQAAIATGSGKLITPYVDAGGYCACYDRKKHRLAVIATQISNEQAVYANLLAQLSPIRSAVLTAFNDVRIWRGSILTAIIVGVWIYLGISEAAALAILIGLIIVALALAALIAYVASLVSLMNASQARLAALILMYYRLQWISTCEKMSGAGHSDAGWFKWLFDWVDKPKVLGE